MKIFRLFKTGVKADYFHFGYQRTVSSQKKHQAGSNKYLFCHFFLYETKFKSKFDCASHMNKVLWEFCIRNIYYNFCIFILKYSHLFEYEKTRRKNCVYGILNLFDLINN